VIEALEASWLAEHLRQSRWTYPLVSAGHIMGIGMLVGTVVPMAVTTLRRSPGAPGLIRTLRPFAVAGLVLALFCGALLFIAQAGEYLANRWFQAKLALIALALANACWHLRKDRLSPPAALMSLGLWAAALVSGRMIGFS
jgi:predicted membrane-bound spermidine synthase